MGYDLHICRGKDRSVARKENPITLEEWKNIVENDEEMEMTGFAETKLPNGQTLRMESEGLSIWKKKRFLKQDITAYFSYRNGEIFVSNPSDDVIRKMKDIANKLNAQVIGDEGEEY